MRPDQVLRKGGQPLHAKQRKLGIAFAEQAAADAAVVQVTASLARVERVSLEAEARDQRGMHTHPVVIGSVCAIHERVARAM